jgi:hypothetical protein
VFCCRLKTEAQKLADMGHVKLQIAVRATPCEAVGPPLVHESGSTMTARGERVPSSSRAIRSSRRRSFAPVAIINLGEIG